MQEFLRLVPSIEALLRLEPSQLDSLLIQAINSRIQNPDPTTARFVSRAELENMYPFSVGLSQDQRDRARQVIPEAWQRLESNRFVVQASGQSAGMMTITDLGRQAASSIHHAEIQVRLMLRREMLHPLMRAAVYDNFAGGHYETAVMDAFVCVEDVVRRQSRLPNTSVGINLMKDAFNPTNGPLRDSSLIAAEQERMRDLFVGAIGTFKNPLSHRRSNTADVNAAIEELMFASRLLRYIVP